MDCKPFLASFPRLSGAVAVAVPLTAIVAVATLLSRSPAIAAGPVAPPREKSVPAVNPKPDEGARPRLEMVFALDTTGSMGGLIQGARTRIWSIVNDVMASKNRPEVRIGLVAYRDNGDEYVTKVIPLTSDLDSVYTALMEFTAAGGGDGPENVRRALKETVASAGWSKKVPKTAQIIFLVGDAPPHEDYTDEPDVVATAAKAVDQGILINTIQCGSMNGTREVWQNVAQHGGGTYFAVKQDGGVTVVETPFDKRLGELGARMGTTYLAFGGGIGGGGFRSSMVEKQAALERQVSLAALPTIGADRAVNKALNSDAYNEYDFFQALENGKVVLSTVNKNDLPDTLQKLKPEELKIEVDKRLAERKALRAHILDLSKKRNAFLAEERKKQAGKTHDTDSSFDAAVAAALKQQVAKKGIKL